MVEVAAEMCVKEFGVLHADVLLILPVQRGKQQTDSCEHQNRKGQVCKPVVKLGPVQPDIQT